MAWVTQGALGPRHYWSQLPPRQASLTAAQPPLHTADEERQASLWTADEFGAMYPVRSTVLDGLERATSTPTDALATTAKLSGAIALVSSWAHAQPGEAATLGRVLELLTSALLDVEGAHPGLSSKHRRDPAASTAHVQVGRTPPYAGGRTPPYAGRRTPPYTGHGAAQPFAAAHVEQAVAPGEREPVGPCHINKLPPELLSLVLANAYDAMMAPSAGADAASTRVDEYEQAVAADAQAAAACSFVMSCAQVCKAWYQPATSLGYRHVFIRYGHPLVALNRLLSGPGGAARAAQIADIDILVPVTERPNGHGGYGRRVRKRTARHVDPTPPVIDGHETTAGGEFAKLVKSAINLRSLTLLTDLDTCYDPSSLYLDEPVLSTLISLPPVTSLNLQHPVDFDELEQILNNSSALISLAISGVYDVSGTTAPTTSHSATHLRRIAIAQFIDYEIYAPPITAEQLAWVVEPAATSGTLRDVEIVIRGGRPGFGRHGGGGAPEAPFTAGAFVDLILRVAPCLKRLVLRDPNQSSTAHGSLDHLVSQLISIKELALPWFVTSTAFLSAVCTLPSLSSLTVFGTPTATGSTAFLTAFETRFPALEKLALKGNVVGGISLQTGQQVQNDWSSRTMRKVKQVAGERGIALTVGPDV
ncbi:hypothetical protein JCM10450v2_002278 [Rhodotorula kratochvilovae]